MIADLKPYPAYRLAEGEWLGNVPAHWTVRRIKYIVQEVDARSKTGEEQLLRVSQFTGVTRRLKLEGQDGQDTRAASLVGYKRVEPDELVINIMLAWNGSMGVSRFAGIASPAYCVYRFNQGALPWYFHHLFRSPAYKARIKAMSTGVVESRLRLYSDDLFRIESLLPPPDEQAAIVKFLDWANARLERTIRAKRRVIALLTEQKQAIIHRAVTRGLDPTVPLKPSGIAWLGDIPAHWSVVTIGNSLSMIQTGPFGSQLHSHEYVTAGIPIVNPSHMRDGKIVPSLDVTVSDNKFKELERHRLCLGDVVAARRGELGRCALVNEAEDGWLCGTGSLLLRCKTGMVLPAYFASVFSSSGISEMLNQSSIGATMANLNAGTVARQRIPLPPLDEQQEIWQFVDRESKKSDTTIDKFNREIDLLREYRTRLVADVVTGKLDVREAAARLSQDELDAAVEPEAPDPLDASDAEAELEE